MINTVPNLIQTKANIRKPNSKNSISLRNNSVHSPATFRKTPNVVKQRQAFCEDEEMATMRENLLKEAKLNEYEISKLNQFNVYIREYTQYIGINGKYDEADACSNLSNLVLQEINKRNDENGGNEKDNTANKHQYSLFCSDWENKINLFDDESRRKLEELNKKQLSETEEFEKIWSNDMPRKYRKPSSQLLQMKQIEKSTAISGDYKRAKSLHSEVVELSRIEMENAQQMLIHDYEIARTRLLRKHAKEVEVLNKARDHDKSLLLSQYEQERKTFNNRGFVMQKKESSLGLKKGKPRSLNSNNTISVFLPIAEPATEDDILLPKLVAPNDPKLLEKEKRRKIDARRKKEEFQKLNADETLSKFTLGISSSERSPKSHSRTRNHSDDEEIVSVKGKLDKDEFELSYKNQETETIESKDENAVVV